jgi:hypothetical protein
MSDLTPEGVLVCGVQLRKAEGPCHLVSFPMSYSTSTLPPLRNRLTERVLGHEGSLED